VGELPRTTTTGDPKKDVRTRGDGASDTPGDHLHHTEDDRLMANSAGPIASWRERLRRGRVERKMRKEP
jgi:hypothetical protein